MKRTHQYWALLIVCLCFGIGLAGFINSRPLAPPLKPLSSTAAFLTGSLLTRVHMELPGALAMGDTYLLSAKKENGATNDDGTSPEHEPVISTQLDMETGAEESTVDEQQKPQQLVDAESEKENPASASVAEPVGKQVLIYHSHSRESWLPEIHKKRANDAFDGDVNVSLLGERLQEQLGNNGISAVHSETDYNTAVPGFNYNYSYKYSMTTVKEALAVHKDLRYLLDIHRDSQSREHTTVTINGQDYARLYFIVGQGNPNWETNEALAEHVHKELERRMPGLSKGILTKGTKHGHGEYNQSLSPGSMLVEVGGIDNTLEESYRTIDLLAEVLTELVKEAEKASTQIKTEM